MEETFLIECPKCKTKLEIEKKTGKIIAQYDKIEKKEGIDPLDDMFKKMKEDKEKLNTYFNDAQKNMKEKEKELNKKFEENKKKIKDSKDDSKPINPMDLD